MEDMARLALVEQSLRDGENFKKLLRELSQHISNVLENPHDYELRTLKNEALTNFLKHEEFIQYLQYVGYEKIADNWTYSIDRSLSSMRQAQAAIERKLYFCSGSIFAPIQTRSGHKLPITKKPIFTPSNILRTNNPLLQKIEVLFNGMIKYEDEELQKLARQHIPIVDLQLLALDRVREHQKLIKTGEVEGPDLAFDLALLIELMHWFKNEFFKWVDQPPCERCGGATRHIGNRSLRTETETCRVELYECTVCGGDASFPRYNDARTLLRTRRGRCGEWANCFTLLARALGYDTRYIFDTTDHVWCEVFDYESNRWIHVDPCEAKLDTPLLYCHGWGKRLTYCIALSRDDLQDVTWRYTTQHKEVLKRRDSVDEGELILAIMKLREHRQRQVSEARRKYLTKRGLQELVQLMVERDPTSEEGIGRLSGSRAWRVQRGEAGVLHAPHVFTLQHPHEHRIQYFTALDKYHVSHGTGEDSSELSGWQQGVYHCSNVFRKHEHDWQQVYLARQDGSRVGTVQWRLQAATGACCSRVSLRVSHAVYEAAAVRWRLQLDDEPPTDLHGDGGSIEASYTRPFRTLVLSAELSGGEGACAWQHAQLFRQPASPATPATPATPSPTLDITVQVTRQ